MGIRANRFKNRDDDKTVDIDEIQFDVEVAVATMTNLAHTGGGVRAPIINEYHNSDAAGNDIDSDYNLESDTIIVKS